MVDNDSGLPQAQDAFTIYMENALTGEASTSYVTDSDTASGRVKVSPLPDDVTIRSLLPATSASAEDDDDVGILKDPSFRAVTISVPSTPSSSGSRNVARRGRGRGRGGPFRSSSSVSRTPNSVSRTPASVSRTPASVSRTSASVSRTPASVSRNPASVSNPSTSSAKTPGNVSLHTLKTLKEIYTGVPFVSITSTGLSTTTEYLKCSN